MPCSSRCVHRRSDLPAPLRAYLHLDTITQDCLYLEESSPPAKLAAKSASERSGAGALPSYYGYSFESYCTTSDPSASHTTEAFQVPNTNVQWCSVVKTNLGGVRTIVGGEVDCVLPPPPGVSQERFAAAQRRTTDGYVELKTNMVIQSQRDEVNFERCGYFNRSLGMPACLPALADLSVTEDALLLRWTALIRLKLLKHYVQSCMWRLARSLLIGVAPDG